MSYTSDLHVHTSFSFDGERALSALDTANAAYEKGLSCVALTDHLDVNSEVEHLYAHIDLDKRRTECLAAKEQLKGKIKVLHGIELGQPTQYPVQARNYLDTYGFDFVLGSLHNVKNTPDFALIDYSQYNEEDLIRLWEVYLAELYELTLFDGIHSIAHLTYPLRYYKKQNFTVDLSKYTVSLCQILKSIVQRGMFLEVNSSGFRNGMDAPLPDEFVLSLYHRVGGRVITVGSDSHTPSDIGADFDALERYIKYDFEIFNPN